MPLVHAYNQTVADGTATSVVRPSDWNSAHNQIMSLGGNTSGVSSISGTNIVYQGGNNLTLSAVQGAGAATIILSGANTVAQTVQPVAFSASGGSSNFSTLGFSNANDVTFTNSGGSVALVHGLQASSNTSNITAAAFPSASTTKFAGTGTSATNATFTLNSNGLALNLSGHAGIGTSATNATFTLNSNGLALNLSGHAGTGTTFAGTNISATIGNNSNGLALSLSGGGGVVNQTGPNIAVAGSTITDGTVLFSNSNGVSFGLNGSTMTASIAAGGGAAAITLQELEPTQLGNNTSYSSFGQNTLYFQGITVPNYVSMTAIEMIASINSATSSISHSVGETLSYGFFSKGTGTNSTAFFPATTNSLYIQVSYSSNLSGGLTIGNGANSYTTSSAGTVFASVLNSQKIVSLPMTALLDPNIDYMFGMANSTTSTGNTGAYRMSFLVMTQLGNMSFGIIATNTVANTNLTITNELQFRQYTATSGAWPATIAKTNLNVIASAPRAYMYFEA